MKHIQNNPKKNVRAMLSAFHAEHSDRIQLDLTHKIIFQKVTNQVALISGGGSGHEPADFGYVGAGMLTASVSGDLFTPPYPESIFEAIKQTDCGAGVLLIVKNFASDVEMFTKAKEIAEASGHNVELVTISDDHSIEDKLTYKKRKRGVAGTVLAQKILGAAAKNGASLAELIHLAENINDNLYTLGVALEPAYVPGTDEPSFTLTESEVYFGVGIHGEKGYRKEAFKSSEQLAIELVNKLKRMNHWQPNNSYAVLVNGLGSTPLMEQYIFTNDVRRLFQLEQLTIPFLKVGNHLTSYNMHGVSLTLLKLVDSNWANALKSTTDASHW
ncbi:MAG: dihydroxyacetone kinase subunit DhaK [Bacillota bacterium]